MKKFTAVFWRSNPQLKNGGYKTKRTIEARALQAAKNKAAKMNPIYGGLRLLDIYECVEQKEELA